MRPVFLIILYLAVLATPLVLAVTQGHHPRPLRNELASAAGLVGLAILLVEFVLSGRFRAISRRIGMDVTMRLHQLLARSVVVLLLLHPFLYAGPQNTGYGYGLGAVRHGLNYGWAGLWPGILAWLGLAALVTMALFRDALGYRYEVWRLLHGLNAVTVASLGTLHATRAGRYSSDPTLTAVWWALLAVSLTSLLWVYALKPLWKSRHPWRVSAVKPLSLKTWEVTVTPQNHMGLRFEAGQFAWLGIGHSAFSLNENPFSIASAPSDGSDLRFVIKELGDFTDQIGQIAPGTRAYVDGPYGNLHLDAHRSAPGIGLIAGGVGIAPLLAILRDRANTGATRPATLIYANRVAEQIACDAELTAMTRDTGLNVLHVLSDPPANWTGDTGYVTRDILQRTFGTPAHRDWVYVLCGPPVMLASVEADLLSLGIPARNILSEQFRYDDPPTD